MPAAKHDVTGPSSQQSGFPTLGSHGGQHPSRQCVWLQPALYCSVSHMPHSQWDKGASKGTGLPGNCVFHGSLHWSSNNIIIEIRDRKALLGHCVNTLPVPDCDLRQVSHHLPSSAPPRGKKNHTHERRKKERAILKNKLSCDIATTYYGLLLVQRPLLYWLFT